MTLDSVQLGLVAGLATSMLWVFTSLFFTAGGKRIGATAVNTLRLLAAVAFHLVTYWIIADGWWPEVSSIQFWSLVASGLIGLTLCDQLLFTAFLYIGPRRALLMMTTSPVWALGLGIVLMGDRMNLGAIAGMAMIIAGVAVVILERRNPTRPAVPKHVRTGWIFAALAACFQATGMMFSKWGMGHGVVPEDQYIDPQTATLLRMVAGAVGMIPWLLFRWIRRSKKQGDLHPSAADIPGSARSATGSTEAQQEAVIAHPERSGSIGLGMALTICGAIVGPYLGVWMSLVAADRVPLGVAQTICSLSPVLILPIAVLFMREHVGWRGWVGATVAVCGTALLFLVD